MNKNIVKLNSISLKNQTKADNQLELKEDMLLLAEGKNTEELEILRKIGLDSHFKEEMSKQSITNELILTKNKFKRNSYKAEDIKEICKKYNLILIPAGRYKGPVSLEIAKAIKKLMDDFTTTVEKDNGHSNRTITKSEIDLTESSFFILTDNAKKGTSVTLFYRNDGRASSSYGLYKNDILIEVASFGKPFSEFRRLSAITYPEANIFHILMLLIIIGISVIGTLCNMSLHWLLLFVGSILLINNLFSEDTRFDKHWKEHHNFNN